MDVIDFEVANFKLIFQNSIAVHVNLHNPFLALVLGGRGWGEEESFIVHLVTSPLLFPQTQSSLLFLVHTPMLLHC